MYRLFAERLYGGAEVPTDEAGRIRLDDWELREDVQSEVRAGWNVAGEDNLARIADLEEYRSEFLHMHGFGFDEIDYEADVEL
jgi:enoyl-[acyl-carrier protein] reductase/trans-2-enoyl-CoA reductase (NAD+)